MAKWLVEYAFRDANDNYEEVRKTVLADNIQEAIAKVDQKIQIESKDEKWKAYCIWNCGIMTDTDEEVC